MSVFGKREAIRTGWQLFRPHWKFFLVITIFSIVLSTIVGFRLGEGEDWSFVAAGFSLVMWLLQLFLSVGLMRVNLAVVDGSAPDRRLLLPNWWIVVRYALASILFGLFVILGFVLLILPGIYIAVRLQFFGLAVVDGAGIVDALKKSWRITKGSVVNLVLYAILAASVNLLGVLLLVVGTLLTTPLTGLSYAWVYRKLQTSSANT